MTWEELRDWVDNAVRTPRELQEACRGLGLPGHGNRTHMRARLRVHINGQPNLRARARWQLPGVTPTPATPAPQWSNLVYYAAVLGLVVIAIALGVQITKVLLSEPFTITLGPIVLKQPKPVELTFAQPEPVEVQVGAEVEVAIKSVEPPAIATPTEPLPAPTPVPPAATPEPVTVSTTLSKATFNMGWDADWYRSPFRETTELLADELTWETFAEPGVFPGMGDTQTAWDRMEDIETYMLVPEAGYLYFATGGDCLFLIDPDASPEEVRVSLGCAPHGEERIYLTIVRGLPSDGGDADFNMRVVATDYIRATGIYHSLPAGAYVSLGWMLQQVDNAFEPQPGLEDPNCGDNGCDYPYIVVIDLLTQTTRIWLVGPGLRDWTRVTQL